MTHGSRFANAAFGEQLNLRTRVPKLGGADSVNEDGGERRHSPPCLVRFTSVRAVDLPLDDFQIMERERAAVGQDDFPVSVLAQCQLI